VQRYIGWNGRAFTPFDPEDFLEPVDAIDMTAADLGSAVHEILAGKPGPWPDEAEELAEVFFSSELGTRAASAARAGREWDFIIDVAGTLVRGTVDLWFEENGQIVVVDYKTDNVTSSEARLRAASYSPQLALYALALERAFGKRPTHAWLHFLRPNTLIEISPDDSAIRKVDDLLANLRAAQNTLRFDIREGDHCRVCQYYRSLCPAGLKGPESN
jgi:CRISPR/Cas system-associated exonuclease Cas4 (RecB family)